MTGRTIFVGIDEAGYGPKLGPLVVTATSVGPVLTARPGGRADLYRMLAPAITASRALGRRATSRRATSRREARGRPILVADSKTVFKQGEGLAELERGVLAFLRVAHPADRSLATDLDLVQAVSLGAPDLAGLAWYDGAPEPVPAEADAGDVELAAQALGQALAQALSRAGCGALAVRSRVITAREFNAAVAGGLNKADLLIEAVAELLVRTVAGPPVDNGAAACSVSYSVLVDRLGGRKYYSGLLTKAFPDLAKTGRVREESVSPTESRYVTELKGGSHCRVTFACRAESRCMTVALSSMVSKYVRELMMRRLNRYFAARVRGLRPTAGYPVDAARFLEDTRDFRRLEGLRDELLIRAV